MAASARSYELPFRAAVRAGAPRARRGWLLELEDRDGARGWGEAACWPGFGAGEARTAADLTRLSVWLPGRDPRAALAELGGDPYGDLAPEARCAAETALLDLIARREGLPLAERLEPGAARAARVQALVADAEEAAALRAQGVRCFKLKVGDPEDAARDARRARAVRDAIGPEAALRLDANGAWPDAARALRALEALAASAPEWVEQPLPPGDLAAFAALRRRAPVALALDEGLRGAADLEAALRLAAADAVVLKPMFVGGPLVAQALGRRARAAGLRVVFGHAHESAVGRAAVLHLAAASGGGEPAGLGSLLARDLAPLGPLAGDALALPAGPGLGLSPSVSSTDSPLPRRPVRCGPQEVP